MADIVRYVDTGAAAGGNGTTSATSGANCAYQSLSQCEAAEDGVYGNLASGSNTLTIHCNRTNGGGQDTSRVDFGTDWITDSDSYLTVIADDFPADGKLDTSKYILHTTNDNAIINRTQYSRLINLQIQVTQNDNGADYGIYFLNTPTGGSDNRIDSCIIHGVCSGTGDCWGINIADADCVLTIFNTVIYDFRSSDNPSDTGFRGIGAIASGSAVTLYNCTLSNCYIGFYDTGGATTAAYNCAIFNNADDFYAIDTVDYCASDDGDGTNGINWANEATDWNANFTDYANGDFSVKDTDADIYDAGTSDPGSGLYSDDLVGTARSTWDIGAFEYVAPAGGGEVLIHPGLRGGMVDMTGGLS